MSMYLCIHLRQSILHALDRTLHHFLPAQTTNFALGEESISTHGYPPEECHAGRTSGRST